MKGKVVKTQIIFTILYGVAFVIPAAVIAAYETFVQR